MRRETMRKILCPLRGHPQFPCNAKGVVVYVGGVHSYDNKALFSCSCKKNRTFIIL